MSEIHIKKHRNQTRYFEHSASNDWSVISGKKYPADYQQVNATIQLIFHENEAMYL